jgi:hypothetical protein
VSIRTLCLVGLLAASSLSLAPAALAKGKPTPKPPPAPSGFYYHVYGLVPGHTYRLALQSKSKVSFTANAVEDVLFVNSGRLGSSTKSLNYKGTTPKTYNISQPVKGSLQSWRLTLQIMWTKHTSVSVHLTDLSGHHS